MLRARGNFRGALALAKASTGTPRKRRLAQAALAVGTAAAVFVGYSASTVSADPGDPQSPPVFTAEPTLSTQPAPGASSSVVAPVTGDGTITKSCQWQSAGTGTVPGTWADISGATACSNYAIPTGEVSKWYRVEVTASSTFGGDLRYSRPYRVGGDVVFRSYGFTLWAASQNGQAKRQLTPSGANWFSFDPDISPDGTQIAFASNKDPNVSNGSKSDLGIWVMNSDGTNVQLVADNPGADDKGPQWSPDGSTIVYESGPVGTDPTANLYRANADGSGNTLVYPFRKSDVRHWPSWNPAGTSILFHDGDGRYHIKVDPNHDAFQNQYFNVTIPQDGHCPSPTELGYNPPGGAVSTCRAGRILEEVSPAGAGPVPITSDEITSNAQWNADLGDYRSPRYAPTGSTIAMHSQPFGSFPGVFLVNPTSGSISSTQIGGLATTEPEWSSDSTKVLYHQYAGGNYNLRHARVSDGGDVVTVDATNPSYGQSDADWGFLRKALPGLPNDQLCGEELALNQGDENDVNAAAGAYRTSVTDITIPGIDIPFAFSRSYCSLDMASTALGPSWVHSYESSLAIQGNGDVKARAGDGQYVYFTKLPSGAFEPAPGGQVSTLVKLASTYELTSDGGLTTSVYTLAGRLSSIRSANGKQITLAYDGSGRLDSITDTVGRLIDVQVNGSGKLTSVVLSDGRHVDYGYDASGRLQTVTDLRGKVWTYAYDGTSSRLASINDPRNNFVVRNTYDGTTGRLTSQLDPLGNQTTFAWNASTQAATITDPAGEVWQDTYSSNVLVGRTDPLGNHSAYDYDESHNATGTRDPRSKIVDYLYDVAGNLEARTHPNGDVETWTYNVRNQVETYRDANGETTEYTYDANGNVTQQAEPEGQSTSFVVNSDGLVTSMTDARGKTWTFTYDASGNKLSETSPLGNKTTWTYDGFGRVLSVTKPRGNVPGCGCAAQYTRTFTYDAAGNRLTETDELGRTTTFAYDDTGNLATVTNALNKTWTYEYDAANRRTKETAPNSALTQTQYDNRGNVTAEITPLGFKTTYTYDDAGRRLTMVSPRGNVSGADPNDFKTTYTYDENGNLKTETNPLGGVTTHVYDDLNRRTSTTDPRGKTTTFAYDANGNLTSVTNALGKTRSFVYDEAGRKVSETDERGKTWTYAYDAAGNVLEQVSPLGNKTTFAYDDDGRLVSRVSPRGNVQGGTPADYQTSYAYDPDGNQTQETSPLGHQTSWTYDRVGRKLTEQDANAHLAQWQYEELGRLAKVIDPVLNETTYTYDDVGNLITRTDAKGHLTTYAYDLDRRLTSLTAPLSRTWTYEYDAEAHRTKKVDANGNATSGDPNDGKTTYTFDRLGRLSGIDYSDATPDVSYGYDAVGNRTSLADGQPANETSTYDDLNRLLTVTRGSDTFSFSYDDAGNLTQRVLPGGATTVLAYDDDGRPSSATIEGNTTSYAYDADSNLTSTTYPGTNGYLETRTYDRSGRLSEVKNAKGGVDLSLFTYTRDPVGNPTQIAKVGGAVERYAYDSLDRLTEVCYQAAACGGGSDPFIRWAYDAVGNRLTESRPAGITTSSYDDADRLTERTGPGGAVAYAYDQNGNETQAGSRTFAYDLADRLASTTLSGQTTTYAYDGDGKRLQEAVAGGQTTNYVWDRNFGLPQLALERDGQGATLRRYGYGQDLVSMNTGSVFYFHADGLGSVANVTNASGAAQWTYEYEPYGAARSTTQNDPSAPENPIRFTGEYLDAGTGLYHLRARQYDPASGRFLATDPVPAEVTDPYVSTYIYVSNRPALLVDPSGLCGWRSFGDAWDCVEKGAETVVQVALGVKDLSIELVRATAGTAVILITPGGTVRFALRELKSLWRDYKEYGALGAFNLRNPGFWFWMAEYGCKNAAESGTARDWGRECARAAFSAGGLIAVATGAARGLPKPHPDAHERSPGSAQPLGGSLIGRSYGRLGTVVANPGIRITGFRGARDPAHGLNQVINRGVSPQALRDTVRNPRVVLQQSGNRYLLLSEKAGVAIRSDGQVVTAYSRSQFEPHILQVLRDAGVRI